MPETFSLTPERREYWRDYLGVYDETKSPRERAIAELAADFAENLVKSIVELVVAEEAEAGGTQR